MFLLATSRRTLRALGVVAFACLLANSVAAEVTVESIDVGFNGCWKLGHWTPVRVQLSGLENAENAPTAIQATLPDSDGAPTVYTTPVAGSGEDYDLTARIGRRAELGVRVLAGESIIAEQTHSLDSRTALPATSTLVVRLGASGDSLPRLTPPGAVYALLDSAAALPFDWSAYEAIDLLIIESAAADAWAGVKPDGRRIAALTRWVESGGHLLLSLGEQAEALVGAEGPLANLTPGAFRRVVELPSVAALERYADAQESLVGVLRVAQLAKVQGTIEAHGPGEASDLPLIVRTPRGLGEVLTLTFDINTPELASWPGRERLLDRLTTGGETSLTSQRSLTSGQLRQSSSELAAAVRSQLGASIPGVSVTPFLAIVAATLIYLALIGPGDYFFLKRVVGRMSLTWLTFTLIVTAASAAVIALGVNQRGDRVTINQLELVDVDTSTGLARGTFWGELYSPTSQRHYLMLQPGGLFSEATAIDARLGWFGAPGAGLAGMQSTAGLSSARSAYGIDPTQGAIHGMPINTASTKSLSARWVAELPELLAVDLTANRSGLVEGTLINNTGTALKNARLLYGEWAWRLGALAEGQAAMVDEDLAPLKITSLLKSELNKSTQARRAQSINVDSLDAVGLLKLMMFYQQAGGADFAQHELRYQREIDLSGQLRAGRAVLIAEPASPPARLVDDQDAPIEPAAGQHHAFYRFVLPVAPGGADPASRN